MKRENYNQLAFTILKSKKITSVFDVSRSAGIGTHYIGTGE